MSYYQAPGQYGRPGYGGYPMPNGPPGMAPPGMGPPPGVPGAAGMAPPGMPNTNQQQAGRGAGIPANFQPPPGMNFNAPVIRLGTSGAPGPVSGGGRGPGGNIDPMSAGGNRRHGLGSDSNQRGGMGRDMMNLAPPTKEEIARTIFIGNITEGVGGDEGLERILRCAGGLRRWTRCQDADGKACKFGFAEYEDAESLETAAEIFQEVQVPLKRPGTKNAAQANGDSNMEDDNGSEKDGEKEDNIEMATLLVVVDEASKKYAEEWKSRRNDSPETVQFRMDTAKESLAGVLASLLHPEEPDFGDGDLQMHDAPANADGAEVLTIPISAEDELSDIPPEMREIVAAEIAAFRDRSNRRDLERLKREEELEAARATGSGQKATSTSAPAGGANGIPLGPRADRGVQGAPTGPRGMQGVQIPKDYQGGVAFVNGGTNGLIRRDDDDLSGEDSDLELERQNKIKAEMEKKYLDSERRWLNRERTRTAALKREEEREKNEEAKKEREKENMARILADWNDDAISLRKTEEYYTDHSAWMRKRKSFRDAEAETDKRDREHERREQEWEKQKKDQASKMADDFLSRQAEEMERSQATSAGPAPFKMSLSLGPKKTDAAQSRRTAAEVENLLEDEEDEDRAAKPRTIIPLAPAEIATMSEEERKVAARQLASDIPNDREGLAKWQVRWESLDDTVIEEQLVPFVEKKIVEYLGVQEQMLVDVVQDHIRKKGNMEDLISELEGALDDEAEGLVKKLWRMIIFFSESEKRGLSA